MKSCEDPIKRMDLCLDLINIYGKTPCCGQDFRVQQGLCMAIECACGSFFCGWCRKLPSEIGDKSRLQAHVCNCEKNPNERIMMRENVDGVIRLVQNPHFKRYPAAKNPTQFEIERKIKLWNRVVSKCDMAAIIEWISVNTDRIVKTIDGGLCDAEFEKVLLMETGMAKLDIVRPNQLVRRMPFGPGALEVRIVRGDGREVTDDVMIGLALNAIIANIPGGDINHEAVDEFQRVIAAFREETRDR